MCIFFLFLHRKIAKSVLSLFEKMLHIFIMNVQNRNLSEILRMSLMKMALVGWGFMAVLTGCSHGSQGDANQMQASDTVYTKEAAMAVYDKNPDRALLIIDSAVIVGNIEEDYASMLRAYIYSHTLAGPRQDTALQICETLMESDFVEDLDNRQNVLDLLVDITRKQRNYEQCLRWATEKADFCRQQGEETEALRTEAEIGVILSKLGEEEKGLAKLSGVIANLDGQRYVDEMDACVIALKRKIQVLQELGREEEVIPLAHHIIQIVNDYRQHSEEYNNNSYRLSGDEEETQRYCDFYASQSNGYMAHAFAATGKVDSSKHYLSLFEQSDYGRSIEGRKMIAPTWGLLGNYDKMLATYDEWTEQMGADTLNFDYLEILKGRAEAAKAKGKPYDAVEYLQRYVKLGYQLNEMVHKSHVHEYAVRYQLQEERINTEREKAAKKRMEGIALFLGLLVVIIIVFIILMKRRLEDIRRKNAVLAKEIADRIEYEEKYHAVVEKQAEEQKEVKPTVVDPSTLTDKELFEHLRHLILEENLYLNPLFDQQQLIDRLHLSKDRIGAAFAQGSEYRSLKNFLNEIRLQLSAKLLTEHPEMSVAEVAAASGFASYVVFARNFKQRFAITPTEFRERGNGDFSVENDE